MGEKAFTNIGWPHEKKLHERIEILEDVLKQILDAWPDAGMQPHLREKILQALGEV